MKNGTRCYFLRNNIAYCIKFLKKLPDTENYYFINFNRNTYSYWYVY